MFLTLIYDRDRKEENPDTSEISFRCILAWLSLWEEWSHGKSLDKSTAPSLSKVAQVVQASDQDAPWVPPSLRGKSRTHWMDHLSSLAWKHFRFPKEESIPGKRDSWVSLLDQLSQRPTTWKNGKLMGKKFHEIPSKHCHPLGFLWCHKLHTPLNPSSLATV